MKKFLALMMSFVVLICLTSCGTDRKTVHFKNAQEAYEAMTDAVENGNYEDAIAYYNSGAADSGNSDVVNHYYFSVAMNDNEEKGCLGYPLDIISRCSDFFEPSKDAYGELQLLTRSLDGAYHCGQYYYLYFIDGKIAIGDGGQLTGSVYCDGELVCKDGTYYWAEHNTEGDDTLLYKIEITVNGITLTAVDETNNTYEGQYTGFSAEMPILTY